MFEFVLVHLLPELGWYKVQSILTAGVCKVSSTFTGIKIFPGEVSNGGIHFEFMVD